MSSASLRVVRFSLAICAAVLTTTASFAAGSPFDELRTDPFTNPSSGTSSSAGKLVDLTSGNEKPIELSEGARIVDAALVGNNGKLLGIFASSDRAFSDFISPASNPLFFEDPRTLTELRFHFANQWIPHANPVFQGGTAQFLAAQIRVALTQRLSIIATKDGYLWLNPGNPTVPGTEGFADVAAGLKYNLFRNPASQTIVSVGGTFELDTGAHRVFQGRGDGEFHLFSSAGQSLFDGVAHWVTGSGLRLPTDTEARSSMWYWSNQWDVKLTERVYVLSGVNWFHWFDAGNTVPVNFEGQDLINLGASGVAGHDVVTGSLGMRYRFGRMNETGVCWEYPLTDRRDLLQSRLYVDLCLRF
ncbi:MAG: hypothetical protein K8U03_20620 [Planctomycetia bacterium]|nr:hypothetical protein [Planctomycetia bacterium]